MDLTETERQKGKTEEVGQAYFETKHRRFTILDAPGHGSFVPNMIGGAAQADVGVLVISSRKGEFETGFEKGGQTREHTILSKIMGIEDLIVVINKIDDKTVKYSEKRYQKIVNKLKPFLKRVGYDVKNRVKFCAISGMTGEGMKEPLDQKKCPWYTGKTLLEELDCLEPPKDLSGKPTRMTIIDKYRASGVIAYGKIVSGKVSKNEPYLLMPLMRKVTIAGMTNQEYPVEEARSNENTKVRLKGVEEEEFKVGYVLSSVENPVPVSKSFLAQVNLLKHESIICPGYQAVMHLHSTTIECTLSKFLAVVNVKKEKVIEKNPKFMLPNQTIVIKIEVPVPICLDIYQNNKQLGIFTLRTMGKTIAVGRVTHIFNKKRSMKKKNIKKN
ncbi:p-loop containing nucleoside triphosphate hydrolase protein [Anaeramoeba flamelloides]|uniref:P-loop containing nucleoside triphosphate hydrolase protein n=1 Tax=Anaeramoeba flamelloides TaxID=1746091 RepID=A0AAV8A2L5_9EUKA|nr:p-loop containing nucleoside triphosphate hydrolase protein [Anaeramoeba flamelloides]